MLSGPAREGLALLQGLLLCADCGRALTVRYQGNGGIYPIYECNWKRREGLATKSCLAVRTDLLDDAICEEVFKALKPAELELALAALNELEQRDQALMRQWHMRIERPSMNALWPNVAMKKSIPPTAWWPPASSVGGTKPCCNLDAIKAEAAKFQSQKARVVTPEQKAEVLALARDLPRLWRAPTHPVEGSQANAATAHPRHHRRRRCPMSRQVVLHVAGRAAPAPTPTVDAAAAHRTSGCVTPPPIIDEVRESRVPTLDDAQIAASLQSTKACAAHEG